MPGTQTMLVAVGVLLLAGPASAQWVENDCEAIHTIVGEFAGDQFGWVANPIGDVTGDSISDFISTAPTNDGNGANSGRIYVYDGATGVELWRVTGLTALGQLGHDGDGVWADFDDDTFPDVNSDVQDPREIALQFEGRSTDANTVVTLLLRNWNNGNLVPVGTFTIGFDDTSHAREVANVRRFVRLTDGRIELLVKQIVVLPSALSGFFSSTDLIELRVR